MKPQLIGVVCASLTLAACGKSAVYETISIRSGEMHCSENIKVDNSARPGITVRGIDGTSSYDNTQFALTVPGGASTDRSQVVKRCKEMLELATKRMQVTLELDDIKRKQEMVELQKSEAELQMHLAEIEMQNKDLIANY